MASFFSAVVRSIASPGGSLAYRAGD